MKKFKVNRSKCIGCGACLHACPYGAIEMDKNGKAIINQEKCRGCGKCRKACPVDAIDPA